MIFFNFLSSKKEILLVFPSNINIYLLLPLRLLSCFIMINHQKKYIFVHIPKTAGVSIYELLGDKKQQSHKHLYDYDEYYRDYFSFAVVRNPLDRLVSAYTYMNVGGRGFKGDLFAQNVVSKFKDFKDFSLNLEDVQDDLARFSNKHNGKHIVGFPHLHPQTLWTHEGNLQIIDYVIHLENLENDFKKIRKILGKFRINIPNKNTSDRKDYAKYYDHENLELVIQFYKDDFENLGYSFELPINK